MKSSRRMGEVYCARDTKLGREVALKVLSPALAGDAQNASDESDMLEIYIRPFPAAEGKWKVSLTGGQLPRWCRDGRELFYLSPEGKLMAAKVNLVPSPQPRVEVAAPDALFEAAVPSMIAGHNRYPYAVTADGKRFLVNKAGKRVSETPHVVTNWLAAAVKK